MGGPGMRAAEARHGTDRYTQAHRHWQSILTERAARAGVTEQVKSCHLPAPATSNAPVRNRAGVDDAVGVHVVRRGQVGDARVGLLPLGGPVGGEHGAEGVWDAPMIVKRLV
jgi:hypothetical protein